MLLWVSGFYSFVTEFSSSLRCCTRAKFSRYLGGAKFSQDLGIALSDLLLFNFNLGTVVGIMKGFLGLSGAILIQIYRTLYGGKAGDFLLMLAILPTLLPILLMFLVKILPRPSPDDNQVLDGFSIVSLLVASYLTFIIIWENLQPLSLAARLAAFFFLLLLLVSPLLFAISTKKTSKTRLKEERTPLREDPSEEEQEAEKPRVSSQDTDLVGALGSVNFWLLFLAMACGMGSGLATVNNITQVGGSLGYTTGQTGGLVSLWSIWNFLGRFGGGFLSDLGLQRFGWGRPLFMTITLATMALGHGVIASGAVGSLYAGSVLVGVCYGCQWSLMPAVTSEIFGVLHMGTIFNVVAAASPVGSYLLSVRLIGYVYDREAAGEKTCLGVHCFRFSFMVMAGAAALGAAASATLFIRTRRFYHSVVFEGLRRGASS
ncbi:uncharacterized protein LOC144701930 isoform X2 [Wolffia australiana]